jgi:hypothetical protein
MGEIVSQMAFSACRPSAFWLSMGRSWRTVFVHLAVRVENNPVLKKYLFNHRAEVQQGIERNFFFGLDAVSVVLLHPHGSACPGVLRDDLSIPALPLAALFCAISFFLDHFAGLASGFDAGYNSDILPRLYPSHYLRLRRKERPFVWAFGISASDRNVAVYEDPAVRLNCRG